MAKSARTGIWTRVKGMRVLYDGPLHYTSKANLPLSRMYLEITLLAKLTKQPDLVHFNTKVKVKRLHCALFHIYFNITDSILSWYTTARTFDSWTNRQIMRKNLHLLIWLKSNRNQITQFGLTNWPQNSPTPAVESHPILPLLGGNQYTSQVWTS